MRAQTLSIVVGGYACNAKCPYCVASMTPAVGLQDTNQPDINERNFHKAANLAKSAGVTTVMLTGKGEPTLYQKQVSRYLQLLEQWDFPIIEIQTNGILMEKKITDETLAFWYAKGLTTVAISVAGLDPEKNRSVFMPYADAYMNLPATITRLNSAGFTVRLNCILHSAGVASVEELLAFIAGAKQMKVAQTTLVPVEKPAVARNDAVGAWTQQHALDHSTLVSMENALLSNGTLLYRLTGGAMVLDVNGQNACWSNCLTKDASLDELRNLIFYGNGTLRHSWEYEGAVVF